VVNERLIPGDSAFLPPPVSFLPTLPDVLKQDPSLDFRQDEKTGLCKIGKYGWSGIPLETLSALLEKREGAVQEIGKAIGLPGYTDFISLVNAGGMRGDDNASPDEVNAALAEVGVSMRVEEDEDEGDDTQDLEGADE